MTHLENPIAASFDYLDFIIQRFYESTALSIHKIIRNLIQPLV